MVGGLEKKKKRKKRKVIQLITPPSFAVREIQKICVFHVGVRGPVKSIWHPCTSIWSRAENDNRTEPATQKAIVFGRKNK